MNCVLQILMDQIFKNDYMSKLVSLSLCLMCAELGNAWANENIFTAAEGIIWFRYHNYVASQLQQEHPTWSDEELFQNARKTVVATFQVGGEVCVRCSRCPGILISTLEGRRLEKHFMFYAVN